MIYKKEILCKADETITAINNEIFYMISKILMKEFELLKVNEIDKIGRMPIKIKISIEGV